jgi:hypothetical protein
MILLPPSGSLNLCNISQTSVGLLVAYFACVQWEGLSSHAVYAFEFIYGAVFISYNSAISFTYSLQFELLFCVEDDSDSAIMIVNSLMEKYPKVNAQLFIGRIFILVVCRKYTMEEFFDFDICGFTRM